MEDSPRKAHKESLQLSPTVVAHALGAALLNHLDSLRATDLFDDRG